MTDGQANGTGNHNGARPSVGARAVRLSRLTPSGVHLDRQVEL
jgi:hypothetical protein